MGGALGVLPPPSQGLTRRGEGTGVAAMVTPGEVAEDALALLRLARQHQRLQEGPGGPPHDGSGTPQNT